MSKKLTAERIAEIEKMPIVYDDDSPQLTKEELQEFVPYHRKYFDIVPKKVLISFKVKIQNILGWVFMNGVYQPKCSLK